MSLLEAMKVKRLDYVSLQDNPSMNLKAVIFLVPLHVKSSEWQGVVYLCISDRNAIDVECSTLRYKQRLVCS